MGICVSKSYSVATANLILQDGELRQFSNPVRVSDILQEDPTCFVCNSDDMDLNKVLSAMSENEELQLGELYFALPISCLNSPLSAEEMASLAIRASSAMQVNDGTGGEKCFCNCFRCGIKRINYHQMVFKASYKREDESDREIMLNYDGDSGGGCDLVFVPKRKQPTRGVRRGGFIATLSVILEEEPAGEFEDELIRGGSWPLSTFFLIN